MGHLMSTATLRSTSLPALPVTIGVPDDWSTVTDDGQLLAVEPMGNGFSASVHLAVYPELRELPADPLTPLAETLVAPSFVDLTVDAGRMDVLVCHLAGGFGATALQRYVVSPAGLVVATVTGSTARWSQLADLARSIVDSLEVAA
jgi:hypothetical protein